MITFKHKGNFKHTETFLNHAKHINFLHKLHSYGAKGVNALSVATPIDSGLTASSWAYEIQEKKGYFAIKWFNSHIVNGVPIAIIIQYGHATGNGGYVQGRDYINPALKPIFDNLANEIWREVTNI